MGTVSIHRTSERNLEKIFLSRTLHSSFFGWGSLRRLGVSVPRKIWVVHRPPENTVERIAANYSMLALVLFWALDQHMLAWYRVLTAEDNCRVTCAWVPPSFSRWSRQPRLVHSTVPEVPVVLVGRRQCLRIWIPHYPYNLGVFWRFSPRYCISSLFYSVH